QLISEAAPDQNARNEKFTAEQLFHRAAERLTKNPKFGEGPEVEATIELAIGDTHCKLAALDEAEKNLRRSLDIRLQAVPVRDPETLAAQEKLADCLSRMLRKYDEAEALSRQTWEARCRVLGKHDSETLDSLDAYAAILYAQGKLAQAEPLRRECSEALRL